MSTIIYCCDCRFWDPYSFNPGGCSGDDVMDGRGRAQAGGCRRHSPRTAGRPCSSPLHQDSECSVAWPITGPDDWCGDAREIGSEQLAHEATLLMSKIDS